MSLDKGLKDACLQAGEKFLELRRPPFEIRDKLDIKFTLEGQNVLIYEVRPLWNDPSKILDIPIAKATFVKSKQLWKIFWQRADLKWHSYPSCPTVEKISDFFEEVHKDQDCCFFG
ncbi:DUF3024 domain-containing protein [bacterium]|nr:DUF3024 domain-containing protein [bacterium]